jgi:photosystem II stability/assembly factor-like uncharacterized protein
MSTEPNARSPAGRSTFNWELIDRVTVAGPDGSGRRRWRAIPSAARLRDGTLLVAYREGTDHWITPDGAIRLCRSTDSGRTWSAPQTIAAAEGRDFGCHLRMAELEDGTVVLPLVERHSISGSPTYLRYNDRRLISTHVILSHDGGHTWSPPRPIDLGSHVIWTGSYGDVLIGREGEAMMSVHWQQEGETTSRSGLLRSRDGGQSWGHLTQISHGHDDEQSVCTLPSGRMIVVMRDLDRPSKRSFSDDGGETWSPAEPLPFHGQCPSLLQTRSGVLLCSYRQRTPGKPQGVGLSYSYDGGETWAETDPLYVSPLRDCAYANLLELSPGEYIAVYYTAAMGTEYLVPQDYGRDPEELERESPELLKYTDADNEIELVRFRER